MPAGELKVGERLLTLAGPPPAIVGIEPGPADVTVYNVTVEGFHTYFVADAALWVHNDKATSHDDPPPDDDGSGDDGGGGDPSGGDGDPSGAGGSTTDGPSGGGSAPPPA